MTTKRPWSTLPSPKNEGVATRTIDQIASMIAFWMKSGSLSVKDGLVAKCCMGPIRRLQAGPSV